MTSASASSSSSSSAAAAAAAAAAVDAFIITRREAQRAKHVIEAVLKAVQNHYTPAGAISRIISTQLRSRVDLPWTRTFSRLTTFKSGDQGRLSPQQPRCYFPNFFLFPSLPHFPFPLPSLLPPPLVLPSISLLPQTGTLKPAGLREHFKLPQLGLGRSTSRYRSWCILRGKNSFDSDYYMDFSIVKFVKLLMKFLPSPQKIVPGTFVANGR